jgi:hypothetical protein
LFEVLAIDFSAVVLWQRSNKLDPAGIFVQRKYRFDEAFSPNRILIRVEKGMFGKS